MASVFLSHSSLDKPLARRIANDLKSAGHRVWLDEREIYVGHSITAQVQQGLEQSDFIAVLLSVNSVRSGWVEKEWQSRVEREVRLRSVEILPLRVDDCEIPLLLRDKKWADFRDYQSGLAEVLRALSHHGQGQPKWPALAPEPGTKYGVTPETASSGRDSRPDGAGSGGVRVGRRARSMRFVLRVIPVLALVAWIVLAPHCDSGVDTLAGKSVAGAMATDTTAPVTRQPTMAELLREHNYGDDLTPRRLKDLIECSPVGCRVSMRLCSSDTKALRLGRTAETHEFVYDLQKCAVTDPGDKSDLACFAPPEEIFPLRPGATVFASVEYQDDSRTLPFEVPVQTSALYFDGKPEWAELVPQSDAAPFAAAKFVVEHDQLGGFSVSVYVAPPFKIFVGIGGCPTPRIAKLLYDLDGRGLVEVPDSREHSFFWPDQLSTEFTLPRRPRRSQIAIAFDTPERKRVGPFLYQFDVQKILQAAASRAGEPRLDCSVEHHDCVAPGMSSALAWMQVKRIEYGLAADRLSSALAVATPESYLLSDKARVEGIRGAGIGRFDIPAGWEDVYYRLVFESGVRSEVIRVQLR